MARKSLIISLSLACLQAFASARSALPTIDLSTRNTQISQRGRKFNDVDFWGEGGFWGKEEEEEEDDDDDDDNDDSEELSFVFEQGTAGSGSHSNFLLARSGAKKPTAKKWRPPQLIIPPNMKGKVQSTLKCDEKTQTCTGGIRVFHDKREIQGRR